MSLVAFDLRAVFGCAVDLARAAADCRPEACAASDEDAHENGRRRNKALDAIERASGRLQRALGAQGPLDAEDILRAWRVQGQDANTVPNWLAYYESFKYANHPEEIIRAFNKLAAAAIQLRGYASVKDTPAQLREDGLKLLRWGLAQLWAGMAADERKAVRHRLAEARVAIGWPPNPSRPPAAYAGPADIPAGLRPRNVDRTVGIASRTQDFADEFWRRAREAEAEAVRAEAESLQGELAAGEPESDPEAVRPAAAPVDRHDPPPPTEAPVIELLGDRKCRIWDATPPGYKNLVVSVREEIMLQAFLRRPAMDLPDLATQVGYTRSTCASIIRGLVRNYHGWLAPAIRRPGARGRGGYEIRVRRVG